MAEIVSNKLPWESDEQEVEIQATRFPWEQKAVDDIDQNTSDARSVALDEGLSEDLGFFDGLGFNGEESVGEKFHKLATEDSFVGRAGGILFEKAVENLTDAGGRLVRSQRRADKYEEWQPQIWDAEDRLNAITDRTSSDYQEKWEDLQNVKRNFVDDLAGNYVKPEDEVEFKWGEFWDTVSENKGFMLGAIARGLIADPMLIAVPGGWNKTGAQALKAAKTLSLAGKTGKAVEQTSKLAGEVAGAFTLGAGLGASAEYITQADDDPDAPIDFERVANTAVFAGGIGAVLPLGASLAKFTAQGTLKPLVAKASEVMSTRKIKNIEKDAQKIWTDSIDEEGVAGLTKQASVNRAIEKTGLNDDALQKAEIKSVDEMFDEDILRAKASIDASKKGLVIKTKDGFVQSVEAIGRGFNEVTQPVISRIRNMGMYDLSGRLTEHSMNTNTLLQSRQSLVHEFGLLYGKLSEIDQIKAALNMDNSSLASVEKEFGQEFVSKFGEVRKLLDQELVEMNEVGIDIGDGIKNYFPRQFNYQKYAKDEGLDLSEGNKLLAEAINDKFNLQGVNRMTVKDLAKDQDLAHRFLNENDIAHTLAKRVMGSKGGKLEDFSPVTSSLKRREIDEIKPEMLKYYKDPIAALSDHITRMTIKIEDRRFFGGKRIDQELSEVYGKTPPEETMLMGYIRDEAARAVSRKEILPAELEQLEHLLKSRFVGSRKRANKYNAGLKNILYAATLGNQVAAATQLGDIGAAAYLNTYKDAMEAVARQAIGKSKFTLDEFGLETLPDIESMNWTRSVLDWSLKLGSFRAMDRLGKKTILDSTYTRLQTIAKKSLNKDGSVNPDGRAKALAELKNRYGRRLGDDEVMKILDGINSGDTKNHSVRLAVYSDLTRVQPINMDEMPAFYLNNPDMRIFFMLKTFTLKQIDLMRQESLREIRLGMQKSEQTGKRDFRRVMAGMANMGKIAGTIGLGNMGIDAAKRWLQGEDIELGDASVSAILRNYGLSQYTLDHLVKGDPVTFAAKIAQPPTGVITNPLGEILRAIDDDWGRDSKGRWIDSIPLLRAARFAQKTAEERF